MQMLNRFAHVLVSILLLFIIYYKFHSYLEIRVYLFCTLISHVYNYAFQMYESIVHVSKSEVNFVSFLVEAEIGFGTHSCSQNYATSIIL